MAQASAKKFEHAGPAEQERVASVPQNEQSARTVKAAFTTRKRTISIDRHSVRWERVEVSESCTLGEKG